MKTNHGFVIQVKVADSTLYYNAKLKMSYTNLEQVTIYGDRKSALIDIKDKTMGCSTGIVIPYNEAKKICDEI